MGGGGAKLPAAPRDSAVPVLLLLLLLFIFHTTSCIGGHVSVGHQSISKQAGWINWSTHHQLRGMASQEPITSAPGPVH